MALWLFMQVTAKLRRLRISPKKVRLIADLVKKKEIAQALAQLDFSSKRAAKSLAKLIRSAQANAENNFGLDLENLAIKNIIVDQGPTLKRWRARAFGRAAEIRKKTSHITVILEGIEPKKEKSKKEIKEKELHIAKSLDEMKKQSKEITEKKDKALKQEITHLPETKGRKLKPQEAGKFKGFVKKVFARKAG